MLKHSDIIKYINYDPESGIFTWKLPYRNNIVGKEIGDIDNQGYKRIRFKNHTISGHRLAWFYCFKEWPEFEIDHINRNKLDNRLDNLRDVSRKLNTRNIDNNSSYGYNIYKRYSKYRVVREIKGILKYFGSYSTLETAIKVRDYIDYCQDNNITLPTREELYSKYETN